MRKPVIGALLLVAAAVGLVFLLASSGAQARPAGQTAQRQPRRGDSGSPPLPTPRRADGTPNLGRVPGEQGVWDVKWVRNMADRIVGTAGSSARGATAADATSSDAVVRGGARSEPHVPFMPWSAAMYDYNSANLSKYDPEGYCLRPGGPRMMATPYPMEIIKLPEQRRIIMIFEGASHIWREIYMDGRPHPRGDALNPTYLGHAVGRWEGDTLVVDVVGFNEGSWIDYFGHPHTDLLHVVEKFLRPDKNTLHYEATIDDPGAYTRSWTISWDIPWNPNGELTEYICQENNRYLQRLTDDFGQPIGTKPQR